jgi:osmotically-inducible protein OsmY
MSKRGAVAPLFGIIVGRQGGTLYIETRGGKVILSGSVRSCGERAEAQWAAWVAPGVSEVENDIIISP